jgi:peptidoglycan/LPS O-acetylase OafA/YrhL
MRSPEIDFLRGSAVILVLFSHHWLFTPLQQMGWCGVDLFFVLSGFLVSGLLFKEYKRDGKVEPVRFLIRRGFKIYPAFYFSVLITTILLYFQVSPFFPSHTLVLNNNGLAIGFLIESLFLQSYFFGFWGHHWSLAIEEHFYIGLTILVMILSKRGLKRQTFIYVSSFIFLFCFVARIAANLLTDHIITFTGTHLRIDSLFAGVLISYFYHFEYEKLERFYNKFRTAIMAAIVPLVSFTPFFDALKSPFVKTIGFTMLWVAFSCLLLVFLFEKNIGEKISKTVGKPIYVLFTRIGFYSYGIYLFHLYVVRYLVGEGYAKAQYESGQWAFWQVGASFATYFILSILVGILLSRLIEIPALKLRERWFPKRIREHAE